MNFSLAREIYGGAVWMVDASAFTALKSMLNDLRNGLTLQAKETKSNSIDIFDAKSSTKIVTDTWQLNKDFQGDELIYVINLNGVITKNGGESTYGMKDLAAKMSMLQSDARVIGGIMFTDSGGGSNFGREVMSYAIEQRTKPLVTLVERGGVMASAAYGIASQTDWIISESEKAVVGSIGTMVEFIGVPSGERNGNNEKELRFYATKSIKKNKEWEEAINNSDGSFVIKDLDTSNEDLIKSTKNGRPQILESQLDGSIYKAGDVVGTLVDQIGTFQDALNKVKELSKTPKYIQKNSSSSKLKTNNTAMTAEEFKQQHPAVHQQVYTAGLQAGIAEERDRVGSWMAHAETDLAEVKKGIDGGNPISATARENFLVKQSAASKLAELKSASAPGVVVPEATTELIEEKTEAVLFYADLNKS